MNRASQRLVRRLMRTKRRVLRRGARTLRRRFQKPVWGLAIRRFGPRVDRRFRTVTQYRGVLFRARTGQRVRAAYSGKVVYVGPVAGYGNVVIVDHAKNLYSLYGHLLRSSIKKDAFVTKGTTLGRAGTSGARRLAAVYFEIREKGLAVDPKIYLGRY